MTISPYRWLLLLDKAICEWMIYAYEQQQQVIAALGYPPSTVVADRISDAQKEWAAIYVALHYQ
jgi:hypothetical protein